jgi:hypothetical protein
MNRVPWIVKDVAPAFWIAPPYICALFCWNSHAETMAETEESIHTAPPASAAFRAKLQSTTTCAFVDDPLRPTAPPLTASLDISLEPFSTSVASTWTMMAPPCIARKPVNVQFRIVNVELSLASMQPPSETRGLAVPSNSHETNSGEALDDRYAQLPLPSSAGAEFASKRHARNLVRPPPKP